MCAWPGLIGSGRSSEGLRSVRPHKPQTLTVLHMISSQIGPSLARLCARKRAGQGDSDIDRATTARKACHTRPGLAEAARSGMTLGMARVVLGSASTP